MVPSFGASIGYGNFTATSPSGVRGYILMIGSGGGINVSSAANAKENFAASSISC